MDLDIFDSFSSHPVSKKHGEEEKERFESSAALLESSRKKRKLEEEEEVPSSKSVKIEAGSAASGDSVNAAVSSATSKGPAKVYKFNLDPFQREAIGYIDNNESVLVAAHTSAGKTAVAEYAIAKSLRDRQRVIYTSPIKALSNQKYRDLQEEFGDVGLMTGDMTINPNATCLIMTTEILRSMLYRGSEVVREIAWVIYDEVHYMRDKERGVVWEESIILLPHKVRFVFLSATIPNALAFVDWVSEIHHQPCHVVYTDYRPVPLQHFLFPSGGEGLYLVVDEKSKFRDENFQRAMTYLQSNAPGEGDVNNAKSKRNVQRNVFTDLSKIIHLIMARDLGPCIVFSFSKKDCELYALQMGKLEFNNEEEKQLIEHVFSNAMESLAEDDKNLPQIQTILPLLKRGVGIHHGGLLPILKEVIEILFQEGLIKCLFATETFSIGINMPARTVVFTNTRKFDGKDFRWITSGEYIQMSGRAGRRGKDDKGIVIQMLEDKMEPDVAKNMIYGASDPLYSSYQIKYNMVLNMMRVEGADPQHIIKSSFHQYTQEANAPNLRRKAEELEREADLIIIPDEGIVSEYVDLSKLEASLKRQINAILMEPKHCLPFLQAGRMIEIEFNDLSFGWGAIVEMKKLEGRITVNPPYSANRWIGTLGPRQTPIGEYYVDVLLEVNSKEACGHLDFGPANITDYLFVAPENTVLLVHVGLDAITSMSAVKLNIPRDIRKDNAKQGVRKCVREVCRRFATAESSTGTNNETGNSSSSDTFVSAEGIPLLHPVQDMTVDAQEIMGLLERHQELSQRVYRNSRFSLIRSQPRVLEAFTAKLKLLEEAKQFRHEATALQSVTMKEELKSMRRVLKRLEYVNAEGVLTAKGRFACEVSAGDELVLTNMIFSGVFNDLTVDQTVALLSCFENQEKSADSGSSRFRQDMQRPFRLMQATAREVAQVLIENKLLTDEEEFLKRFDPSLIDVTYAWSSGMKFSEVCKLSEIYEGSIIRALRRLEELLRQLAAASVAIGNNELVQLFTDGSAKIRRGVVFAASLYI
jgi:ATP-dependent RNA helicase DOB1